MEICFIVLFQIQKWCILERDFSIPGGELGRLPNNLVPRASVVERDVKDPDKGCLLRDQISNILGTFSCRVIEYLITEINFSNILEDLVM